MYKRAKLKAAIIHNYVMKQGDYYALNYDALDNLLCEDGIDCTKHQYCAGVIDAVKAIRGYK
jgi:hypothetical protein